MRRTFLERIGFIGQRKSGAVRPCETGRALRDDRVFVRKEVLSTLVPHSSDFYPAHALYSYRHGAGAISRTAATALLERTGSLN